jgi:hypothetical protein
MATSLRHLLQGFRLLVRAPGFAATAALTLALGIGATTTLFSVVNAVLLDPLPFPESGRLLQIWRSELPALTYGSASYPRYLGRSPSWARGPRGDSRSPGATAPIVWLARPRRRPFFE